MQRFPEITNLKANQRHMSSRRTQLLQQIHLSRQVGYTVGVLKHLEVPFEVGLNI
jgi:hypothetical protein